MITEQKGSSLRPIEVNDEFFEGISAIVEEFRTAAIQKVAAQERLSRASIDKIIRNGSVAPARRRKRDNSPADRDFHAEARKIEEEYMARRVLRDIGTETSTMFRLKYADGYSFQAETVEEIKDTLAREPSRPESLSIAIGNYYGSNSLNLRLYNYVRSVSFDLRGERQLIEHIQGQLVVLLRKSEPAGAALFLLLAGPIVSLAQICLGGAGFLQA